MTAAAGAAVIEKGTRTRLWMQFFGRTTGGLLAWYRLEASFD